jgi:RimJ/RimL family protein N-acetyltransferase
MKTIETPRLRLRPRTLDDLEPIVALDTDPEVRLYLGGPLEAVAHRAEVRGNIVNGTMPDYLRWAIEWRDQPGFLGQCLAICREPPSSPGARALRANRRQRFNCAASFRLSADG